MSLLNRGARADRCPLGATRLRLGLYLCYGIHHLLNLAMGEGGQASAVLIRACQPVEGVDTIRARRGGLSGPAPLTDPGKVAFHTRA